ncbi:MAG: undecaprenyl-diphosphate phosphatase [Verrucomicrobiota bacterium]|jgi:undecaprenyl-diphosphatase|nr:undecaprenyl-diphosphate phosphatase [Verrucomicrobiota bacterium]MDI9385572.1 undecaprenyl-diphosphate phosphatase [Verrucomicrobiota bacterium]HCF94148.1 hypothetical protein [Verrucomicrobiota bacterium]
MTYWEMFLLAAVQGVTEFLPVSSSGHLALLNLLLGVEEGSVAVVVLLHAATLVAVVLYFFKDLWSLLFERRALIPVLILATIPVVVIGLAFHDLIEAAFGSAVLVGVNLLVTGLLLWIGQSLNTGKRSDLAEISWKDGLGVGLAQSLSILPGISRSGSTIAAGMALGLDRALAARFSFLVSVPALAGAALYEGLKLWKEGSAAAGALNLKLAGFGFGAAFLTGLLSIHLLLKLIQSFGVRAFAVYCWCAGILTIGLALFLG